MTVTRSRVASVLVALAGFIIPRAVSAQVNRPPTVLDCDAQLLIAAPPDSMIPSWKSQYPSVRMAQMSRLLSAGQWKASLDTTKAMFDRSVATFVPANQRDDSRISQFRDRLDEVIALVDGRDTTLTSFNELQKKSDAVRRVGRDVMRPEVRDGGATLFRGSPYAIAFSDADNAALRRAVCYHAGLASQVLDRMTLKLRGFATEVLAEKERRWTTYFDRGYSQLPWELYFNSRRARSGVRLDPPTSQLILLHPSIGVQLTGISWKDIGRRDAVLVEPFGWIWYRNDYRSYFGVSGVVGFTEQQGSGAGPFMHFGRVAKVGYLFPLRRYDPAGQKREGGVLISVDLYKFLSDRQAMAHQTIQRVSDAIGKLP